MKAPPRNVLMKTPPLLIVIIHIAKIFIVDFAINIGYSNMIIKSHNQISRVCLYVIRFAKGSHTHACSFKSHFSMPFNRYNSRLTVHVYIIPRSPMVCFYWSLIYRPFWHLWVFGWPQTAPTSLAKQTASRESLPDWLMRLYFVICGAENSLNWHH